MQGKGHDAHDDAADEVHRPQAQVSSNHLPGESIAHVQVDIFLYCLIDKLGLIKLLWPYILFFKVPTLCTLWVFHEGERIRVASGRVHPTGEGDLIHNEPLPADCYKVCLELVHDGCDKCAVPYPVEDEPAVAKHLGFFLKWPRALVSFTNKVLCK